MFLGRICAAPAFGVAADSPDRPQGAFDHRPDLRQGPDQLFLFFPYNGIVFHIAILYNYYMALSSPSLASLKKMSRESLIRIISELETRILNLEEENKDLKNVVQTLKDEIRRLKSEKGRPLLKPSLSDRPPQEKKKRKTGNWTKSARAITVTRRERLSMNAELLPPDARSKGTRTIIIQDLRIEQDNVEFELERYYSAREKKTYESRLPPGYEGSSFGPGIRHLVLALHYQGRMPQKLLQTFLSGMGVRISEGEVASLLVTSVARFEAENEMACRAAVQRHGYQHIDDTGARLQGKNGATIVTGNESFVAYHTGFYKNRLAALQALWRTDALRYRLNAEAISYIRGKLPHTTLDKILKRFRNRVFSNDRDFEEKVLGHPDILRFNPLALRYVREAAAVAAFREDDSTKRLVCDDAGQFKGLTSDLQLCWVHVMRHFKALDPLSPRFRNILERFLDSLWTYYEKLTQYKRAPRCRDKARLWREFDNVFKPETGYYALDRRIQKVLRQKTDLLTVLSFPETPLHNNPCELDVREKVVQRKIRNCHRSAPGAKASDLFLGLMGTCRKNKIGFWEFLKDRIYQTQTIPELQKIINSSPTRASPCATTY
jgi:regulator of replication initiation timing